MSDDLKEKREAEQGYRETSLREVRLRDYFSVPPDKEFTRLVWRLRAKKYWAAKPAERKARIRAYRREWALQHPEQVKASMRKAKAKRRKNGRTAAEARARRAKQRAVRRAATVYTCAVCGAQWSPIGRIPSRPPKYCMQACRSRAGYLRARARGDGLAAVCPPVAAALVAANLASQQGRAAA